MSFLTEELLFNLNRSGPVPLYYQIANLMREAIESERISPGARIENEVALAEQLNISRPTIRRAISELVDEGLLVRRRGIGTQVVQAKARPQVKMSGLYDDLIGSKRSPTTKVLLREVVNPSQDAAEHLGVTADTLVLHIRRLRFCDGAPYAILENYLPPQFIDIEKDALEKHGLYRIMRSRGTTMQVAQQTIGARMSTDEEAKLLLRGVGSPVLTMARTLFDQNGRAIEYGFHAYAPELHNFQVTLVEK